MSDNKNTIKPKDILTEKQFGPVDMSTPVRIVTKAEALDSWCKKYDASLEALRQKSNKNESD